MSIRDVEQLTAPEAIIRCVREQQGEIDGVFIGPLTNLAVALMLEPRLSTWFHSVTIMGGAFFNPGNETPDAEFNIFTDPEAADFVARSGIACTWVGLDVTRQVAVSAEVWNTLDSATTPAAVLVREVCRRSFETRGLDNVYLHDPLAVAAAVFPELVGVEKGHVRVDVSNVARGETRLIEGDGESSVAESVDSGRFVDIFMAACGISSG